MDSKVFQKFFFLINERNKWANWKYSWFHHVSKSVNTCGLQPSLPAHPRMSQTLMMNRIREEEAGRGRGYCPSLRYPFRFGRTCTTAKMRLRAALPRLRAPNSTGWKPTTNPVAASRFGQQNVSRRGEAMARRAACVRRREQKGKEKRGEEMSP